MTLDVRFEAAVSGSDLTARIDGQASQLLEIGSAVASLTSGRTPGLEDLERALGALSLPDIRVPDDLAAGIRGLESEVPPDLSGLVDGLLAEIGSIETALRGFVEPLSVAVGAVEALADLASIDIRCQPGTGASVAVGIAPAGGGAGGGAAGSTGTGSATSGGAGTTVPSAGGAAGATATAGGAAAGGSATAGVATGGTMTAGVAPAPSAEVARVKAVLEAVPEELGAVGVLEHLNDALASRKIEVAFARPLPFFHEFRNTLATLVRWRNASASALRVELGATIEAAAAIVETSARGVADKLAADLAALDPEGRIEALDGSAGALTARLDALGSAIGGGDAAAIASAAADLAAAADAHAAVAAQLEAAGFEARCDALAARLAGLPDDLDEAMSHCISVLRPDGPLGHLPFFDPTPAAERQGGDDALAALEQKLGQGVVWLQDVLHQVDLGPFAERVAEFEATIDALAAGLDQRTVEATLQVRGLFQGLERQVDAIDTAALAEAVETETREFADALIEKLTELLGAVRDAVSAAIGGLDQQLEAFDPAESIEAIRDAIASLAGVLEDPEVRTVADGVRTTIEGAADQIASISFAPVADEVIAGIDAIAAELDKIDESKLNAALSAALSAAVSVLPDSIEPVTGQLTVELSGVVESGPIVALSGIQQQIQGSLGQVRRFEPAALVGPALATPYKSLLADLDAFSPSATLDPAREQLDEFRTRLREQANPGRAIEPLEGPFAAVLAALDRVSPDALAKPLEDELGRVVDAVVAPPLAALDGVLAPIESVVGRTRALSVVLNDGLGLIGRIRVLLAGIGDEEAIRQWVDQALDRVGALTDVTELRAGLRRMDDAFAASAEAELRSAVAAAVDPLVARIAAMDPSSSVAAVVQAHRRVMPAAVAALPDSAAKTAAAGALARIDPLDAAFGGPFRALTALRTALDAAPARLVDGLVSWDQRYLSESGAAACLRVRDVTPAALREWLAEDLELRFTRPVVAVATWVGAFPRLLAPFLRVAETVCAELDSALDALLAAPETLLRVRGQLDAVSTRVRGLGGAVLREALSELFASVRAKVEAVSPAQLRAVIEEQFGRVLDALTLDAALPDLGALDAAHRALVERAQALDPQRLVIEVVQPEFDVSLGPLIEAFDLSASISILIEKLRGLDEELNVELARVDEAYRRLLRSVPGGGASISASVSVHI